MYSVTINYLYNEEHRTCFVEGSVDDAIAKASEMFHEQYGDYGPDDVTSIDIYKREEF